MRGLALGLLGLLLIQAKASPPPSEAQPIPATGPYRVIKNIDYQNLEPEERGDLYLPERKAKEWSAPAVIWMHGNQHDKADDRERHVAADLAAVGYVCFSINYGVWPTYADNRNVARVTQNVINAKNAVRFLRTHAGDYHVDAAHIALFGGSAGANLAMLAGFSGENISPSTNEVYPGVSCAVTAIGDMYGAANLDWLGPQLTAKSPPVLIIHGKEDPLLDYHQSIRLDQLLTEKGVPHQLLLLDGIGHGFDFTSWKNHPLPVDLRPTILAFLRQYLGPPATSE